MAHVDEQNNSQPLQGTTTGSEDNQDNEQGGKTMYTNDSIIAKVTTDVNSIDVGLRLVSELGTKVTGEIKPSSTARVGLNYVDSGDLEYVGGFAFATDQPVHESAYVLCNESLGQSYVVYVFDEHEQVAENNQARAAALKQWQNEAIALGIRHGEEVESLRSKESSIPVPGCNGWEAVKVGYPTSRGELLSGKRMKQSKPKRVPEETEVMNVPEPTPEDVRQLEQQFTKELVDKVAVVELESKSPEEIHERRMVAVKSLKQAPKASQNSFLLELVRQYYEGMLRKNTLTEQACDGDKPITDRDINLLAVTLQDAFPSLTITPETLRSKIYQLADRIHFDPVQDYITSLPVPVGDGELAIRELAKVLHVEPTPLALAQLKYWSIGFVWRRFKPMCKMDYALFLKGSGGGYKSEIAEVLSLGYLFNFTKQHQDRDTRASLSDVTLVNVSEADRLWTWFSPEEVKEWVSAKEDVYRVSGAHGKPQKVARGFVIIGSTNNQKFIRDDGDGRRYWVVETESSKYNRIDLDRLKVVWDAVLAACYVWYRKGVLPMLPTAELEAAQEEHVQQFMVAPPRIGDRQGTIRDLVEEFLSDDNNREAKDSEIIAFVGTYSGARVDSSQIKAATKELGYSRQPRIVKGVSKRIWTKSKSK